MVKEEIGVFAGSFDPFTNGHLAVLKIALRSFQKVVILVMKNPQKQSMFTIKERLIMISKIIKDIPNVSVDTADGYTVDYAVKIGAKQLIRGVRGEKDVAYEHELMTKNKELNESVGTMLIWVDAKYENISSTVVKEMFLEGKNINEYVPYEVIRALAKKLNH